MLCKEGTPPVGENDAPRTTFEENEQDGKLRSGSLKDELLRSSCSAKRRLLEYSKIDSPLSSEERKLKKNVRKLIFSIEL